MYGKVVQAIIPFNVVIFSKIQELLANKDIEIAQLNDIIAQQKEQITVATMDTDKTSVVALSKVNVSRLSFGLFFSSFF